MYSEIKSILKLPGNFRMYSELKPILKLSDELTFTFRDKVETNFLMKHETYISLRTMAAATAPTITGTSHPAGDFSPHPNVK
jgi:hypothetical protein